MARMQSMRTHASQVVTLSVLYTVLKCVVLIFNTHSKVISRVFTDVQVGQELRMSTELFRIVQDIKVHGTAQMPSPLQLV